ncbi:gephyrin-like molybdotransferase receptor GlpR [Mycobacterium sp. NPDC006124]|uniref:divisome protein SepX/GlpR n=1 Tax=Mycobacterium sp. NPDC006124 TaxID=3156729 RepID=UPI0033BE5187
MPSIPQSLLWISLVVLWLFVLVPMLISKRDTVRRTSDVALATRVLNSGQGARLLRRRKPAAGHHSDPDWRPTHDDLDDDLYDDGESEKPRTTVVVMAAAKVEAESEYLDVDVVEEDSGALPIGASARARSEQAGVEQEPQLPLEFDDNTATFSVDDLNEVDAPEPAPVDQPAAESDDDMTSSDDMTDEFEAVSQDDPDHDYEYVDDSSGIEAAEESEQRGGGSKSQERRRTYETKTAAAVSARKYRFRKRVLMAMSVLLLLSAVGAYVVSTTFWWVCGTVAVVTVLYLAYLRRQTAIEEQVRRRRAQRMMRSHLGVENTKDQEFDVVPARLRRPGSVVLEIDDEDPIFEHLDYATFAREYDLPRASGQ